MTSPLPDHGTYARFVGRPKANLPGCRCHLCKPVGQQYTQRRDYLSSTGRSLRVPADKARAFIATAFKSGIGFRQLASTSGVCEATLRLIADGTTKTVRRSTETKLLAIRLDSVDDPRLVPTVSTTRRLQALQALGHSVVSLAQEGILSEHTIRHLLSDATPMVRITTHNKVVDLYSRRSMVQGSNGLVATRSIRRGWAPPLAWDEETIGDPKAVANWTGECGTRRGFELHQTRPGLPAPCPRCVHAEVRAKAREARLAA